jgi:anti-sigma-K factor RskA
MSMDHPRDLDPREHDELAELAVLSSVGALLPDEQRRVAAHLAHGCTRCEAELRESVEAADVMALAAPALAPSAGAREALLRAVEAPVPIARASPTAPVYAAPRRARGASWAALAASLALVLSSGSLLAVWQQGREARVALAEARSALEQVVAEQGQRTDELAQRVGGFEQSIATLSATRVQEVALGGEAGYGQATARVVMDSAGQQVLLLASRVPPLPPGRTYQLWVIVSGTPRSLGVFRPDTEGRVVHVETESETLPTEGGVQVAVSVEPAGGVPQPTGPIVLVSH